MSAHKSCLVQEEKMCDSDEQSASWSTTGLICINQTFTVDAKTYVLFLVEFLAHFDNFPRRTGNSYQQ